MMGMSKEQQVEAFNTEHPVGSPVTVKMDSGGILDTSVKHPAQVLGGHTPVVWLEGISGCYALSRVWGYCHGDKSTTEYGAKRCCCPCINFASTDSLPMPTNEESVAWAEEADRLANALWDLVHVIEVDDLIPETVSYMRQARKVLQHWPNRRQTEEAMDRIRKKLQERIG